MNYESTQKVVLLAMLLAASGCVSSDFASQPRDPANPTASSAPPSPDSQALSSDFDPFEADGKATAADSSGQHDHGTSEPKGGVLYVCPMHPEVQRTQPGRCPKCGMQLEPRKAVPK